MLTKSEPNLETQYADKTIVFPIFGRARSLYGFVGKGINRDNVLEACAFLAGPASHEAKARKPGTDMLLAADWDAAINEELVGDDPPPALAGLPALVETGTVATTLRSPRDLNAGTSVPLLAQPVARPSANVFMLIVLAVLAGIVVIAVVVMLVVLGGRRKAAGS